MCRDWHIGPYMQPIFPMPLGWMGKYLNPGVFSSHALMPKNDEMWDMAFW